MFPGIPGDPADPTTARLGNYGGDDRTDSQSFFVLKKDDSQTMTVSCEEVSEKVSCRVEVEYTPAELLKAFAVNSKLTFQMCSLKDGPARGPMECFKLTTGISYEELIKLERTAKEEAVIDPSLYSINEADKSVKLTETGVALPETDWPAFTKDADGNVKIDTRGLPAATRNDLTKKGIITDNYGPEDMAGTAEASIETLQLASVPGDDSRVCFMDNKTGAWESLADFKTADVWKVASVRKDYVGAKVNVVFFVERLVEDNTSVLDLKPNSPQLYVTFANMVEQIDIEAPQKAREEAERIAKEEADRIAREEAERKAAEEAKNNPTDETTGTDDGSQGADGDGTDDQKSGDTDG